MKMKSPRRFLAVCGLLGLAACTVNIAFDISKDTVVVAPGSSIATTLPIDLSSSKEVQDHKGSVQSLSLDSLDLTVTAVAADNLATSVTGRVALRASSAPADGTQDVLVGAINALPIKVGSKVHIPGNPKLDEFFFKQLQGNGKFSAVISGETQGGPTHATIEIALHASMGYGVL